MKSKDFEDEEYNPYLLTKIQPSGGIKFDERVIQKGDGYETVLHLYDYKQQVNEFWLAQLTNITNSIVSIDISTENKKNALKKINKSMVEQKSRVREETNEVNIIEAQSTYGKLHSLVEEITNSGEVVKLIHIRYYLSAKTRHDLDIKVKELREELEGLGFGATICLNEQEYEWQSLFMGYSNQLELVNKRHGKALPSISLSGGYPFHFTSLSDPTGVYLGTTRTGGNVLFDIFTKNEVRKSYNALVLGMMGSGKSTLLKKLVLDNAIVGNTIRVLDVVGEFKDLIHELGGKSISLDGTSGIINPLQVFATVIDENTNEVNNDGSYTTHLSKLTTMYKFINSNCSSDEEIEFNKILNDFYIYFKIDKEKATEYKAEEYPTMSDFLKYINSILYLDIENGIFNPKLSDSRKNRLDSIQLNIENLVTTYPKLFDGHSTIDDFSNEKVLSFNLRYLTQLEKRIFNAQIYNILTMLWNNALVQGIKEKKAFDSKEKLYNHCAKYLILIDEAHKIINTDNPTAVDYLISFQKEARKYFGSLIFATQSILDIAPSNIDSEMLLKLKNMFGLTQYKFVMQQDSAVKNILKDVFDNQLSESELSTVPSLKMGDCILCINGFGNISFNIDVSEEELELFKGGA